MFCRCLGCALAGLRIIRILSRVYRPPFLVHENSYQPLDKDALAQYDEQLAEYYLTRGSNNRRDTWSDHIRRTIIKESRPFILDYLHKQGWATR
ncbi:nitroreductase A [Escherichia coli]|uniref:Nitroreductase A n=1 Tax=Escherichia coli TaxID=562 RepID=A0A377AV33_ECOLX|nr:nitroreductase A [Escherichia coli]